MMLKFFAATFRLFLLQNFEPYFLKFHLAKYCCKKRKTEKDWSKLIQYMKWLHRTKYDVMTFNASEGISTFEWYIDASFAVHPDF